LRRIEVGRICDAPERASTACAETSGKITQRALHGANRINKAFDKPSASDSGNAVSRRRSNAIGGCSERRHRELKLAAPITIVSAHAGENAADATRTAHDDDSLATPMSFDLLLSRIDLHLLIIWRPEAAASAIAYLIVISDVSGVG